MSGMGRSFARNNPGPDRFGRGGYRMSDDFRGQPHGRDRGYGGYTGGGRRSYDEGSWGRRNFGDSRGPPPSKMSRLDDDGRKGAGSQLRKENPSKFDNPSKKIFLMYCALCNFNTLEVEEMDSHMESDEHKSSLMLVDKNFPKEKMLSRFLHERIRMLNKKTEIGKLSWEKEHGVPYKTKDSLEGMELPDSMQLMDVVRCPACRSHIPALEWEVQTHLQSVRHASCFQDIQNNHFEKIRHIAMNVLSKHRDNTQYERFKKGEDPFAQEILATQEGEERKKEEAKPKANLEVKKVIKKTVKTKEQVGEKGKAIEKKGTDDREKQPTGKVGSLEEKRVEEKKVEEKSDLEGGEEKNVDDKDASKEEEFQDCVGSDEYEDEEEADEEDEGEFVQQERLGEDEKEEEDGEEGEENFEDVAEEEEEAEEEQAEV
uniref:DBIRD complex subunit ZNF326-like isoform X2 n=1 Tax=Myxine glutinosa TaxID=7769 RepID=UPI00358FEDAF